MGGCICRARGFRDGKLITHVAGTVTMLRLIVDQSVEGFSVHLGLRVKEQLSTAVTQTADCDM